MEEEEEPNLYIYKLIFVLKLGYFVCGGMWKQRANDIERWRKFHYQQITLEMKQKGRKRRRRQKYVCVHTKKKQRLRSNDD